MRIPKIDRKIEVRDKEYIHLKEVEFVKPKYIFFNEKGKIKFIKKVEKIIRSSLEYREFTSYLSSNVGMSFCSFFNNVNKDLGRKIKIEIHHEPFTLFDIVSIVVEKYLVEELPLNPFIVAEEVMKLHYQGRVGLIPLSITVHELVHSGKIFIPIQYLDSGFMKFFEEYKYYINDQMKELLSQKIMLSKNFNLEDNNVLKRKFIYLVNEGYNSTPERLEESGSETN